MPSTTVIGIAAFVVIDTIVMVVVIGHALRSMLEPLSKYPAREPEPGSMTRPFQSFSFGIINVGWGFHITVDSKYLHVRPALMERWLRIPPASIPWEEVRIVKPGKRQTKAKIGSMDLTGPTWCLALAGSSSPSEPPAKASQE